MGYTGSRHRELSLRGLLTRELPGKDSIALAG